MSEYRVGIVGCGGISRWAHAPFYQNDKRIRIMAVCDILPDRVKKFRDDFYPDADIYTDYHKLLERNDIDCIDICTPNYLHSEVAIAAFAAGKHVFCEKPDAVSPELAIAMKEAADKAGKLLMVMRNNRFMDISQYMKQYIADGQMGEIYAGRCGWQRRRGIPGKGGWFTTKAQSGGGPLIDLGVHMIDLAIWLMGNPRPVAVSGATYCKFANTDSSDSVNSQFGDAKADGTFDVEDLAMGMIRFNNGATLQIEFSWASNVKAEHRFVELRGTKAGMTWMDGTSLEIYSEDRGVLTNTDLTGSLKGDGHVRNLAHFFNVLDGKEEPCYKPQQGIDMIKILDAIYKSAQTGREVVL
ncbi:MAG: Gfo/Idh/MocA family oxidoreductase [Victivallales bacterium]|nr:Gfo/Idh/MocA family oxidoreductase [Victivallales bacterium]